MYIYVQKCHVRFVLMCDVESTTITTTSTTGDDCSPALFSSLRQWKRHSRFIRTHNGIGTQEKCSETTDTELTSKRWRYHTHDLQATAK